ncbi:CYIR protein, partial [Plasmodium cynomolgi strain B]
LRIKYVNLFLSFFHYDDWRERKELYEYYVDYYPVSETVKIYSDRCNEFYHYVERKKPLYKHFKELCTGDNTNKCPEFYAQCEQYDPDKVLSHLSCHNEIMKERSSATSSVLEIRNTHSDSETKSRETSVVMVPVDITNLNEKSHTITKVGNILLGVVATSMTSGALYRVNIKFIDTNQLHTFVNIYHYYISINNI